MILGSSYPSLCQSCVWATALAGTHPVMLTGYCLRDLRCDRCGRVADLAMCQRPIARADKEV